MASLRQIRRRMKSIENIHEITKAMEVISVFRFKRAENRFATARAYFSEMENIAANLAGSVEDIHHPLFEKRGVRKKTLVVMTGDKGLCGAYNANLLRAAGVWLEQNKLFEPSLIPVGKVGFEYCRKKQMSLLAAYPEKSMADLALAKKITTELKNLFWSGRPT